MTESTESDGPTDAASDKLLDLLDEIVDALGLEAEIGVEQEEGVLTGYVDGEDVGLFIGRDGELIDAVQHLAQRIVFSGERPKTRIVIDAADYRRERAEYLCSEADRAADEVIKSGVSVELNPAPASERRLVHEHLRERGDVKTESVGEDPKRALVVSPLD
jgi:spoIIIJ-associated protein